MRPFWQGVIVGLALVIGLFIGYSMGSTDRATYVADLSWQCQRDGGVLMVEPEGSVVYYNCKTLPAPVEVQSDAVDCSREKEVMHKLIREDYKRKVTAL